MNNTLTNAELDRRAAGEVLEKMLADGLDLTLRAIPGYWRCVFDKNGKVAGGIKGTSAPRVITIAALLAVGAITEREL